MRFKSGILDVISDGSDQETEAVFRQLRPNANYKLKDIIEGRVKEPPRKMNIKGYKLSKKRPKNEDRISDLIEANRKKDLSGMLHHVSYTMNG